MIARKLVVALTASALLATSPLPALAQYAPYESCTDIYNRTMATYQAYGAQSAQYAQMLSYYNNRCLAGASAAPAYPSYYAPDAGAAIMGGIIGGAVLGGIIGSRHHHRSYHGGYHRGYGGHRR